MLGRDAFMWSDRLGLKGATNGDKVANSTACATVFAFKPKPTMVRRMKSKMAESQSGRAIRPRHVRYVRQKRKARGIGMREGMNQSNE